MLLHGLMLQRKSLMKTHIVSSVASCVLAFVPKGESKPARGDALHWDRCFETALELAWPWAPHSSSSVPASLSLPQSLYQPAHTNTGAHVPHLQPLHVPGALQCGCQAQGELHAILILSTQYLQLGKKCSPAATYQYAVSYFKQLTYPEGLVLPGPDSLQKHLQIKCLEIYSLLDRIQTHITYQHMPSHQNIKPLYGLIAQMERLRRQVDRQTSPKKPKTPVPPKEA